MDDAVAQPPPLRPVLALCPLRDAPPGRGRRGASPGSWSATASPRASTRPCSAEARAGRQWTCQDRRIGGYPFRIEVTCAALTVRRGGVTASLGATRSVAQVYQPRHVITEIDGPLNLTDGRIAVQGTWRLLETSVRGSRAGIQRASLVVEEPSLRVTGAEPEAIDSVGRAPRGACAAQSRPPAGAGLRRRHPGAAGPPAAPRRAPRRRRAGESSGRRHGDAGGGLPRAADRRRGRALAGGGRQARRAPALAREGRAARRRRGASCASTTCTGRRASSRSRPPASRA